MQSMQAREARREF